MTMIFLRMRAEEGGSDFVMERLGDRLCFQVVEHVGDFGGLGVEGSEEGTGVGELVIEGFAGVGVAVVEIVHELVGDAEFEAEFGDVSAEGFVERGAEETGAGGELEEGGGFKFGEAAGAGAGGGEVHGLAADEGVAIEDAEEFLLEATEAFGFGGGGDAFSGLAGGEGDEAEGGEEGGGFAELAMDGGLASAHEFIVHAGEVVDNEGGAVEEFDGEGTFGDEAQVGVGHAADAEGEDGPETLAAVEDSEAHRLEDGVGGRAGGDVEGQFKGFVNEIPVSDEVGQKCQAHHDTP